MLRFKLERAFSYIRAIPLQRNLQQNRFSSTMASAQPINTTNRLQALRSLMIKPEYNVSALVIPTVDQRK
ncbi:hypothetical protein EUX98_g6830 [Antrodiella citrinella]|uniref:Uncharacterized protein n=1 Tax=Antrodiella citrinella TaxID=2447956 RepID=A0A4S4MN68_9APHY|nr:hypothetical protein EUX98_g6830 [Antrodiella citrinella]